MAGKLTARNLEIVLYSSKYENQRDMFNGLPLKLVSKAVRTPMHLIVDFVAEVKPEKFATYLSKSKEWYIRSLSTNVKVPTPYVVGDANTYYRLFGTGEVVLGLNPMEVPWDGTYLPLVNYVQKPLQDKVKSGGHKVHTYDEATRLLQKSKVYYLEPGLMAVKVPNKVTSL